jgi:hypothetical protein
LLHVLLNATPVFLVIFPGCDLKPHFAIAGSPLKLWPVPIFNGYFDPL